MHWGGTFILNMITLTDLDGLRQTKTAVLSGVSAFSQLRQIAAVIEWHIQAESVFGSSSMEPKQKW